MLREMTVCEVCLVLECVSSTMSTRVIVPLVLLGCDAVRYSGSGDDDKE